MIFRRTAELSENEEIRLKELLRICDREFVPPLSSRSGTLQQDLSPATAGDSVAAYFRALKEQLFLLAETGDALCGFLSYREGYRTESLPECTYISTVLVHPSFRGKGITQRLYEELIRSSEGALLTRTWSGNDAHIHILKKLGFREVLRKADDRGPSIDTIYYLRTED